MLSETWPMVIPVWRRDGSIRTYALVDADDYEAVARRRWYGMPQRSKLRVGRMQTRSQGHKTILLHRELLGLRPGDPQVDHINGDPLDNRRSNLRVVTQHQNARNRRGANRNSRSGIRGVTLRKNGRWRASAGQGGKMHHLGYYDTAEEAEAAVIAWRRAHMPTSEMDRQREES